MLPTNLFSVLQNNTYILLLHFNNIFSMKIHRIVKRKQNQMILIKKYNIDIEQNNKITVLSCLPA